MNMETMGVVYPTEAMGHDKLYCAELVKGVYCLSGRDELHKESQGNSMSSDIHQQPVRNCLDILAERPPTSFLFNISIFFCMYVPLLLSYLLRTNI